MYYKAYISISTEQMDNEGCIPETYQDHGVVATIQKPTLEELISEISKQYFNLERPIGADVQIFDGSLEIQYEGEHDYRTPKAEQIPFIETARITISKVDETYLDLSLEPAFSKVAR